MSEVDSQFNVALQRIMKDGVELRTRNSVCTRLRNLMITFKETPLVGIRRTAWKSAIREMEWFLSGSTNINTLHPSVQKWWKPFCTKDKHSLLHNYSRAFRRIYNPIGGELYEPETKTMENIPVKEELPKYDFSGVVPLNYKYIGYKGTNFQGCKFTVIGYNTSLKKYTIQFDESGYKVYSAPTNFIKGTVKNPYYPSVLGEGCYGVVNKEDFTYYKEAYSLWTGMMNRCYNKNRHHYKWYGAKGIVVHPRWKCFEFFIKDLSSLDGFEEWLLSKGSKNGSLQLDKDYLRSNYYGPDSCVFLPKNLNVGISNVDRVQKFPRKKLYIDQISNLIKGIKKHSFSRRNVISTWIPQHVYGGLINPTNCHGTVIQAFVDPDNSLHLTMYQRSADMALGTPHNWIQYWAFIMWLAHRTGRDVGTFTWIGGDAHIYEAHYPMVEQIDKTMHLKSTPSYNLVYNPTSLDFKADDFTLDIDYKPVIKESLEMIV